MVKVVRVSQQRSDVLRLWSAKIPQIYVAKDCWEVWITGSCCCTSFRHVEFLEGLPFLKAPTQLLEEHQTRNKKIFNTKAIGFDSPELVLS